VQIISLKYTIFKLEYAEVNKLIKGKKDAHN